MRLFKNTICKYPFIFAVIASLLICMVCSSYGNAGCYFSTRNSDFNASSAQIFGQFSSFKKDIATEETIRTSSASQYGITCAPRRGGRSLYRTYVLFVLLIPGLFCIPVYPLRSYGSHENFHSTVKSLSIAKYIERSDGKK